jgi:hypothetical protein
VNPREVQYATFLANRSQDGRAFGGRVTITNQRITFAPVALSQARGGRSWEIGLTQVIGADVAPRGMNTREGAIRRRLRIRTHAGDVQYFVVWRPRRAARLINRLRDGTASLLPPAGPQAQGWTGKCRSVRCQCLAGVGIHPLAVGQDRPSRLGPAGEGRSDGGVLHLHPRGQARYPEGGRRREDDPPGGNAHSRQYQGDDEDHGDERLNCGGTPHPCDRRAISVQLAPATSGLSRSLADTPTRRSGYVEGQSRTDSQADSAGLDDTIMRTHSVCRGLLLRRLDVLPGPRLATRGQVVRDRRAGRPRHGAGRD